MPIGSGPRANEDAIQQGSIEDCRRFRVLMFQRFSHFGQGVPVASVPMSMMPGDHLSGEVEALPIDVETQRCIRIRMGQAQLQGTLFGFDIIKVRQEFEVIPQDVCRTIVFSKYCHR